MRISRPCLCFSWLNHFLCGIEEWAALVLSHFCGEGCLHPVSLPIAYTAGYVKAACSEASADALTLADGYATHPTDLLTKVKPSKQKFEQEKMCITNQAVERFIFEAAASLIMKKKVRQSLSC